MRQRAELTTAQALRAEPPLAGAAEVVARVRATEGVPYAATLVLDHDDPAFTGRIYDEAAALLERRFARAARDSGPELQRSRRRESGAGGEL